VLSCRPQQQLPHLPQVVPVERLGDGADVGLFDCVTAVGGPGQEEDLFLDVGGEVVEPHDLRHSRCRDLAEVADTSNFCRTEKEIVGQFRQKRTYLDIWVI
jgi:hypothetical protein